jgi:membrane protein required for colicin V production
MNWLDIVLGLILLASVLSSFRKGLTQEIIGLVSVCLALLLGVWFYGSAAGYLLPYLSSHAAANFAGFAVVFCGVLLIGTVLSLVVGKILRITGLSFLDHLLGIGFGILRGLLIGVGLITAIMAFSSGDRPPAEITHSRMAPYFVGGSSLIAAIAPYELKEGFRKSYKGVQAAWTRTAQSTSSRREGRE